MTEVSRHVLFEACFNFRDLGGYETVDGKRVRWNMLFRSDALHRLTPADAQMFASMGLRTVIDLRSRAELDTHGAAPEASGHAWFHLPMLDDMKLAPPEPGTEQPRREGLDPGEVYLMIAERFSASIARIFKLLSRPEAYPAVFHCTAGKDRTGILAALLLEVLGVPDPVIGDDYALTELARERTTAWIKVNEPDYAAYLAQIPLEFRKATPEKIVAFLELLRAKYRSVPEFLTGVGVTGDDLDSLCGQLLEI